MDIITTATTAKTTVTFIENREQLLERFPFLRNSPSWYVEKFWLLNNQEAVCPSKKELVRERRPPTDPVRRALRILEDERDFMNGKGCVYFAHSAKLKSVKIGRSRNLTLRLSDLQVACPDEIKLCAVIYGSMSLESGFHRCFKKYCIRGEWFKDKPVLRFLSLLPDWAKKTN